MESAHGVGNFLPALVADKDVCSEINALRVNCTSSAAVNHKIKTIHEEGEVSGSQYLMDILTDLGWSLKYMNRGHLVNKAEVREALMKRLQSLLVFSSVHCCHAVTQRLIQMGLTTFMTQKIHCISGSSEGQITRSISKISKDLKDIVQTKVSIDLSLNKVCI